MREFIKKYYGIIFGITFVSLLIFSFVYFYYKKNSPNFTVKQVASWAEPPIVMNCKDSVYTIDDVRLVVENWEQRGHQFLSVIDGLDCYPENMPGFIQITLMGQDNLSELSVGETKVSIDVETKEIVGATVTSSNSDYIVLEHEIGHALGYKHTDQMGHIMYPYYHGIGMDDRGLFFELRQEP